MRKSVATIIVLLTNFTLFGQTFDTEFYPLEESRTHVERYETDGSGAWPGPGITGENTWSGNRPQRWAQDGRTQADRPIPATDDHIFYSPAWNAPDPFRELARYRFGAVRYRERGLDDRHNKIRLGGIDLSDNISPYPDYALISLLWKTPLAVSRAPAMVAGNVEAGIGHSEDYSLRAAEKGGLYISMRAADRYSRAGVNVRQSLGWKRGWSHSLAVAGQFGADGHIRGIGSDEAGGALSIVKEWTGGMNLTLFAAGSISERGIRSASTDEAFELTGDDLYNPTWGWQDGRVRNSRMRRVRQIFTAASLEISLGGSSDGGDSSGRSSSDRDSSGEHFSGRNFTNRDSAKSNFTAQNNTPGINTLTITAAFRRSHNGQTRLAWYDTHSPMPDYYRKMPSFFPDWSAADIISDAWRADDPAVTQVDWNALYYNNTLSQDGSATYLVEEQVELSSDLHLDLVVDREIGKEFNVSYGIRVRRDRSRFFKLADDMLGAEWVPNIDQYVTDDEGYYHTGPRNDNDLRNPGRRVYDGDRFGYDYAVTRWNPSAFGIVRWNRASYGITASASLTRTSLGRNGFYEKQLFPGDASFGKSAAAGFTTYSLSAAAYLNLSIRHRLSISALASSEPPRAENVFISPRQNNYLLASSAPMGIYGAELAWAFTGKNIDMRVAGFVNASTGETDVRQYYDDLSSTFANMAVRGIDRLGYGVEAGAEIRFVRWLTLTVGGSVGEFRYNSEPTATLFADVDNSVISEGIVCYMSGLKTGPPQVVAAAELSYSDRKRWRVSLAGEWMGGRYVDINPLYHSSRITGINPAPEIMHIFTSQERLPDAFTLGASVSKGFVLRRGYLHVGATVRNLLSSQVVYSGYEQMRIMRRGSGATRTLLPFPSKYMWSYPLTWGVTVSYRI